MVWLRVAATTTGLRRSGKNGNPGLVRPSSGIGRVPTLSGGRLGCSPLMGTAGVDYKRRLELYSSRLLNAEVTYVTSVTAEGGTVIHRSCCHVWQLGLCASRTSETTAWDSENSAAFAVLKWLEENWIWYFSWDEWFKVPVYHRLPSSRN